MNLPTQAQVGTAMRYATTIAGTAIVVFGLQAKGISLDQVKEVIGALGATVNDAVILIGALGPLVAATKGVMSSSNKAQAAAIGANEATEVAPAPGGQATVTIKDPAMAAAALAAQQKSS